jgi:hypothetical protein
MLDVSNDGEHKIGGKRIGFNCPRCSGYFQSQIKGVC